MGWIGNKANGMNFKVDSNKGYTEEDDKEFQKFVFGALCSVGCSPEYSKEENNKIFLNYLKRDAKNGTKENQNK